MLGHGAGIGYTGPGPRVGPTDNFSLVTGPKMIDPGLWFSGAKRLDEIPTGSSATQAKYKRGISGTL